MTDGLLVSLYVQPGASRPQVGGTRAGALLVRVRARAVEGAATAEVLAAVATAFAKRPREVHVVRGATARHKVVRIEGSSDHLRAALERLMTSDPDAH